MREKPKKKAVAKKKPAHNISDSSSESDHGNGSSRDENEDPPSAEEDGEWEDIEDESDHEMDQALVESLYKAIEEAKKTGPPLKKKQKKILNAILNVSEMPA